MILKLSIAALLAATAGTAAAANDLPENVQSLCNDGCTIMVSPAKHADSGQYAGEFLPTSHEDPLNVNHIDYIQRGGGQIRIMITNQVGSPSFDSVAHLRAFMEFLDEIAESNRRLAAVRKSS